MKPDVRTIQVSARMCLLHRHAGNRQRKAASLVPAGAKRAELSLEDRQIPCHFARIERILIFGRLSNL
jgi:hypothetical protein